MGDKIEKKKKRKKKSVMVVGESVTIFYRIYSCAVVHFDALFDSLFKESCSSLEEKIKKIKK
jgi:hypothetical protein